MKRSLVLAAGAVLVAAAVSAFVYVNNGRNSMDDLFNANVEALASQESDSDCTGPKYNKTCRCKLGYGPCQDIYGCN